MKLELTVAKWLFTSQRREFYADLAEALEDNAVLVEEIKRIEQRGKERKDLVAPVYSLWLRRMDDRSFAECLVDTVPEMDVMIIDALEEANNLAGGLRFVAQAVESVEKMKVQMRRAVAGPTFLVCMFILMLLGVAYFLVPILVQIMRPETWPLIGQIMHGLALGFTDYIHWISGIAVALGVIYARSLTRWTGTTRLYFDRHIPIYSLYRDYVGAMFLVSLAALLQAEVGLSEALNILAKRGSPWLRWHIRHIQSRLDVYADHPATAFDTGVFNQKLTDRIIAFGARSEFHKALTKVGITSVETVVGYVTTTATVLNRILILMCGGFMVFIISGVLLTGQEAQNAIQSQIVVAQ